MTTALTSQTKVSPNFSFKPEPITVLTYAGQFWNLVTMSEDQIKDLHSEFNRDPLTYLKNLQACQAELERRKPGPQKIRIMVALQKNSGSLLEKFSEILDGDRLLLSDLATGAGSNASTRYGEGLNLALEGRWELPAGLGWGFKVDSFPGQYGGLKYEVKCKHTQYHNYSHCNCDDYLYKAAGKLRGWCKHVVCVWFVSEAQKISL